MPEAHNSLGSSRIYGLPLFAGLSFAPRITHQDLRIPCNPLEPHDPPTNMPSLGGRRVFHSFLVDQDRLLDPAGALAATLHQSTYRSHPILPQYAYV